MKPQIPEENRRFYPCFTPLWDGSGKSPTFFEHADLWYV
jgi:hypothetical protein